METKTKRLEQLYEEIRYISAIIWIYTVDPYVILTHKCKDSYEKKDAIGKILLQITIISIILYVIFDQKLLLQIAITSLILGVIGYMAEGIRQILNEVIGD